MKFFTNAFLIVVLIAVIHCKEEHKKSIHKEKENKEDRDGILSTAVQVISLPFKVVCSLVDSIIASLGGTSPVDGGGNTNSSGSANNDGNTGGSNAGGNGTEPAKNGSARMLQPSERKLLRKLYKIVREDKRYKN